MGSWVIFGLLFGGIAVLIAAVQRPRSRGKLRLVKRPRANHPKSIKTETILERHARYQEPSEEMQQRLIDLMQGDRAAAEKLVSRIRFGKPGKSEAYYWWAAVREMEDQSSTDAGDDVG